jgi:WD40 repeat protein
LNTKQTILVPSGLLCLGTALAASFAPRPAQADMLLVANLQSNMIGEYDASTGATIKANFITTPDFSVHRLALDGNNHLFVTNSNLNTVSEYNATTGATISSAFINGQGLSTPSGLALDGNNHLFVANASGTVGEYNAATGATINSIFVTENQGLSEADVLALDRANNRLYVADRVNNNIAQFDATTGATTKFHFLHVDTPDMALDGLNHLFVSGDDTKVSEYDATTGAAVNDANFITGLRYAVGIALDGNNNLFVTNDVDNTVGKYNATTGATINPSFIQGLNEPGFLVFNSPVPEPSTFVLAGLGILGMLTWARQAFILLLKPAERVCQLNAYSTPHPNPLPQWERRISDGNLSSACNLQNTFLGNHP